MILRTIKCDVCGATYTEPKADEGFAGWGIIQGVSLNGADNPAICPNHLNRVMEYVDGMD